MGTRRVFRTAGLVCLAIGTVALSYVTLGREMYVGMWGDSNLNIQPNLTTVILLTHPAEGRIAASVERVSIAARRAGFRPSAFEVRQTNRWYRMSWQARKETHLAGYLWGLGIVLADTVPLTALSDVEMDCVVAHEVGHILQYDQDYPATVEGPVGYQRLMLEMDADLRAGAICGQENWDRFFGARIGQRVMVQP